MLGIVKYKKSFAGSKLLEYLEMSEDEILNEVSQENPEKGYVQYKKTLKVKIPTIEGYAEFIKIHRSTLYDWELIYPEFALALDRIRSIQKIRLIQKGLEGTYNPAIAKFILSSNHGMTERSDVTTGGKEISNFDESQIRKIAERIARGSSISGNTPSAE